jgi:hypothetical protein
LVVVLVVLEHRLQFKTAPTGILQLTKGCPMLGIYWWVMSTPEINQRLKPIGQTKPLRPDQPAARHLRERIKPK